MNMLREFMSDDHRRCDDLFAIIERAVTGQRWDEAQTALTAFRDAMAAHFAAEEEVLFPAFEQATGMHMGPTRVMRMEHEQLRELLDALVGALKQRDADLYLGEAETLLIMMQQHNMKEENILYPMCDQHLSGSAVELQPLLQARLAASA